jgi:hypothetical protein
MTNKALRVVLAVVVTLGTLAWARDTITTPAGCNSEFGAGSGAAKVCTSCVKSGKKYRLHVKNKGAWVCE